MKMLIALVLLLAPAASGQEAKSPVAESLSSLRRRADQGDAATQYFLGLMYANGPGVPQELHRSRPLVPQKQRTRGTLTPRPTSAPCTTTAKECRRTTPRPSAGSAKPPTRGTPKPSTTSASCTTKAKGWRRT
jgi:TPR repeat protein